MAVLEQIVVRGFGSALGNLVSDLIPQAQNAVSDAVLHRTKAEVLDPIPSNILSEKQKTALLLACQEEPLCPFTKIVKTANAYLGPNEQVTDEVLQKLAQFQLKDMAPIPSIGSVLTSNTILEKSEVELVAAFQAALRKLQLSKAFESTGVNPTTLERVNQQFSSKGQPHIINLEQQDPEEWIANPKSQFTQQAQAATSMVRLFADAAHKAPEIYQTPTIQEAIGAIRKLAYAEMKEVGKQFATMEGRGETVKIIDQFIRNNFTLEELTEEKKSPLASLARGLSRALDWLGYRKDGTERGFLGGAARGMSTHLKRAGYENYDLVMNPDETFKQKVKDSFAKGTLAGIHPATTPPRKSNTLDTDALHQWLQDYTKYAGVSETVRSLLPAPMAQKQATAPTVEI